MTEEKKLRCLFYPRLICNVRTEMRKARVLEGRISPVKETDEEKLIGKMMSGLVQVMSVEYAALSNFCQQCFKKHIQDTICRQKTMKKLVEKGLIKEESRVPIEFPSI